MAREAINSWYFVLVVVHWQEHFLLVQERSYGQRWSLPGGKVEAGEVFTEAALRETMEESGVPIALEGILRVEYTPFHNHTARLRVIFLARPEKFILPPRIENGDTLGATWVPLEEIDNLPLRHPEVSEICHYVARGASLYPIDLITLEGTDW